MARNGIYLARAREQIAQQRAENEREHRRRVDDAYRRVPGLRALDQTLQQQMIALVGLTMRHGAREPRHAGAARRAADGAPPAGGLYRRHLRLPPLP